jgi:RNA polymerase sigma-70 factor (ECF subfamily)
LLECTKITKDIKDTYEKWREIMLAIIEDIENEDKKSILSDWYKKYNRIMRKKAYYIIGDYHTANDMVNEAFIKIIQNFEKINKLNCHARSYYFVITIRSVCIDYLRKNKIKSNMSEKGHINEFEKSEMYIDLSNALLKMSERDKELLTYRYTMEMSSKEISKITGIKESNVNSYIRRAREKLLKIFNGEV